MKKVICCAALSLSLVIISACNNQSSSSSIDFDPYTENAFLDFVEENSIYFDVHIDSSKLTSLNLIIGSEHVTGSGKKTFTKDDVFTANEYPSDIYYAFIIEDNNNNIFYTNYRNLEENINAKFVDYFKSVKNYERCYLLMTNNVNEWNRSLSPKLNIYLNEKFFPGSDN